MGSIISIKCPNCGHSLGSTALNSGKGTRTCPGCNVKFTVEQNHKTDEIIIRETN